MRPDPTLSWLADQGARFVLLRRCDKRPCHKGWADRPRSLEAAHTHLSGGGNVGILVGEPSARIVALDLDADAALIARLLPALCGAVIDRANAPQRAKLLLRLVEPVGNRSWRPRGGRRPVVELLAQRRIAVVPPSRHPSGVRYQMRGRTIPELSRERLADVWQILTAEGVVAAAHPRERASDVTAVAAETWTISAIKRRFRSAYAVFDYFGWVGEVRAAGQHDLRLVGHGGLLVGRPDGSHAWRWYCFAAGVGGDVVDAVRWCEGEPHRAAQR